MWTVGVSYPTRPPSFNYSRKIMYLLYLEKTVGPQDVRHCYLGSVEYPIHASARVGAKGKRTAHSIT